MEEEILNELKGINKSLSILAEEAKANRKLRKENKIVLNDLHQKIEKLAKDPFGFDAKEKE